MDMGGKVICLDGEGKTLKTGKERKVRPDFDLYIHPFEKTKRGKDTFA
jgi:hypothetical protein